MGAGCSILVDSVDVECTGSERTDSSVAASYRADVRFVPERLCVSGPAKSGAAQSFGRSLPLKVLLEEAEKRLIQLALGRCGGNRSRAAEMLGVWRPHLLRRMAALGVVADEGRASKDGS